jgi:hypothetical protein
MIPEELQETYNVCIAQLRIVSCNKVNNKMITHFGKPYQPREKKDLALFFKKRSSYDESENDSFFNHLYRCLDSSLIAF